MRKADMKADPIHNMKVEYDKYGNHRIVLGKCHSKFKQGSIARYDEISSLHLESGLYLGRCGNADLKVEDTFWVSKPQKPTVNSNREFVYVIWKVELHRDFQLKEMNKVNIFIED